MLIRPPRHLTRHVSARSNASIHTERSERSEQRSIEQGSPAWIEYTGCASSHRNQVPDAHVILIRDATIFARAARYLGLHPQRTRLRLGMPERFSARTGANKIYRMELLPWLVAL